MSIIKVAGKQFKLASRWARLGAFLLDVGLLGFCQALLIFGGLHYSQFLMALMFVTHRI